MSIEFTPMNKPVPERQTLEVKIDGKSFGVIEPQDDIGERHRWHAKIKAPLPKSHGVSETILIQGFGKTPNEAVLDAIAKELDFHKDCITAIERFAAATS